MKQSEADGLAPAQDTWRETRLSKRREQAAARQARETAEQR